MYGRNFTDLKVQNISDNIQVWMGDSERWK